MQYIIKISHICKEGASGTYYYEEKKKVNKTESIEMMELADENFKNGYCKYIKGVKEKYELKA